MRPAETCFWQNSPETIDLYKTSAQYTKEPTSSGMYGFVPYANRVNSEGEYIGFDGRATAIADSLRLGENEAVSSMYVAIDMDSRHSQQKTLTGSISSMPLNGKKLVGSGTSFTTELQEGDVIKIENQKCYVKEIIDNTNLIIAGRWAGGSSSLTSGTITLINNIFTVLRDYTHLFIDSIRN